MSSSRASSSRSARPEGYSARHAIRAPPTAPSVTAPDAHVGDEEEGGEEDAGLVVLAPGLAARLGGMLAVAPVPRGGEGRQGSAAPTHPPSGVLMTGAAHDGMAARPPLPIRESMADAGFNQRGLAASLAAQAGWDGIGGIGGEARGRSAPRFGVSALLAAAAEVSVTPLAQERQQQQHKAPVQAPAMAQRGPALAQEVITARPHLRDPALTSPAPSANRPSSGRASVGGPSVVTACSPPYVAAGASPGDEWAGSGGWVEATSPPSYDDLAEGDVEPLVMRMPADTYVGGRGAAGSGPRAVRALGAASSPAAAARSPPQRSPAQVPAGPFVEGGRYDEGEGVEVGGGSPGYDPSAAQAAARARIRSKLAAAGTGAGTKMGAGQRGAAASRPLAGMMPAGGPGAPAQAKGAPALRGTVTVLGADGASFAAARPAAVGPPPSSSRDANEAHVRGEGDKLVFSRKARATAYKPATVEDYRAQKVTLGIGTGGGSGGPGYHELGRLGPDLSSEEHLARRAQRERATAYGAQVKAVAAAARSWGEAGGYYDGGYVEGGGGEEGRGGQRGQPPPLPAGRVTVSGPPAEAVGAARERAARAKEYARTQVPRPAAPRSAAPAEPAERLQPSPRRRRDEPALYAGQRALEELEAEHEQARAGVAGIRAALLLDAGLG